MLVVAVLLWSHCWHHMSRSEKWRIIDTEFFKVPARFVQYRSRHMDPGFANIGLQNSHGSGYTDCLCTQTPRDVSSAWMETYWYINQSCKVWDQACSSPVRSNSGKLLLREREATNRFTKIDRTYLRCRIFRLYA